MTIELKSLARIIYYTEMFFYNTCFYSVRVTTLEANIIIILFYIFLKEIRNYTFVA